MSLRHESDADGYEDDIAAEVEIKFHDNRKPWDLRWHRTREAPKPGALPAGWSKRSPEEIDKLFAERRR